MMNLPAGKKRLRRKDSCSVSNNATTFVENCTGIVRLGRIKTKAWTDVCRADFQAICVPYVHGTFYGFNVPCVLVRGGNANKSTNSLLLKYEILVECTIATISRLKFTNNDFLLKTNSTYVYSKLARNSIPGGNFRLRGFSASNEPR